MALKRIILIGLFLFIADLFMACCRCDTPPTAEYKRCNLQVANYRYNTEQYLPVYLDSVEAEAYGIHLRFSQNQNTCQIKSAGLFVNTALACSCDEQYGKALDRFESIKVFTVQPFDSAHAAESDVTAYFWGNWEYGDETSIPEYVLLQNSNNDEGLTYFMGIENLLLRLNAKPDTNIARQFRIETIMTDGRVISELTPALKIY